MESASILMFIKQVFEAGLKNIFLFKLNYPRLSKSTSGTNDLYL